MKFSIAVQFIDVSFMVDSLSIGLRRGPVSSRVRLTTLREKLGKIGAKVVSRRYGTVQMAEVAVPRILFAAIVERITALRPPLLATGNITPRQRRSGKATGESLPFGLAAGF